MKKIRIILSLFIMCFCIMPCVSAETMDQFEAVTGDDVQSENTINGSSMLAGNEVIGNNIVNGVGALFGNAVEFNGTSDYSLLAGNTIEVNGIIKNEGFIFGNIIEFGEKFKVERDLFVFGNEVTINGEMGRDVKVYAATVTVNGVINGDITIDASKITLNDVTINGTLKYSEDTDVTTKDNSKIANTVITESKVDEPTFKDELASGLISLAGMLCTYLAFALITPSLFKRVDEKTKDISVFKALSLTGFGALTLIAIPVVMILLFTFVFASSLALVLLAFYILAIFLANMFTGYLLGNIIWNKFIKSEKNLLLVGLLGIAIIYILNLIPIVSTITTLFSLLIGIGIIIRLFKKD